MDVHHYKEFSVQDFLEDLTFREWVNTPTPSLEKFWKQILVLYPTQRPNIERARHILEAIHEEARIRTPSAEKTETAFRQLQERIQKQKQLSIRRRKWLSIAATIALIILSGSIYFLWSGKSPDTVYTTAYGKRQTIELPDGSIVELNANSQLIVGDWEREKARIVWLEGEAFFSVVKQVQRQSKFIVHTDGIDVEVLGTRFNINARELRTEVVLEEGSVKISRADNIHEDTFLMKPGDLIRLETASQKIEKLSVKTDPYTSWKEGKLIFDDMPLQQVTERLETIYGVKFEFQNPDHADRLIQLSISDDNLDEFLTILTGLSGGELQIKREGKEKIIIY